MYGGWWMVGFQLMTISNCISCRATETKEAGFFAVTQEDSIGKGELKDFKLYVLGFME